MFLGVSGTVDGMELTDAHRHELASLFRVIRRGRFGDSKKDAYTKAGVNSATWERLEKGLSVKPQTLSKVLCALMPETRGDWSALPWQEEGEMVSLSGDPVELVSPSLHDAERYVAAPGPTLANGVTNEELLREIVRSRAESDQIRAAVESLSARVEKLEQHRS